MNINKVDDKRIHYLNSVTLPGEGEIVYLMQREHRLDDNWSFLHALELACQWRRKITIIYIFSGEIQPLTLRSLEFMKKGLQEVEQRASELNISFKIFSGDDPLVALKNYYGDSGPAAVVTDFNPLRESLVNNKKIALGLNVPVIEVDSHNIVPCRFVSNKQEYSAYTLRRKIEKLLPHFLTPFPDLETVIGETNYIGISDHTVVEWSDVISGIEVNETVKPVESLIPGYHAATKKIRDFVDSRLDSYNQTRNDPSLSGQSGLSPYLHFGHAAPQVAALEAAKVIGGLPLKGGFLDEIIVRRELSDNYCFYNINYDNFEGFPSWAKQSLNLHLYDAREYLYDISELEDASTHDELWNAAQIQMKKTGIMHGYMRMYWAKKILEWSADSSEAMKRAVYLNDKYSLDGNDPNGYAGCAWSIGGLHDRAWAERKVFGKIRYMNERGCRRKFDTSLYIKQQNALS